MPTWWLRGDSFMNQIIELALRQFWSNVMIDGNDKKDEKRGKSCLLFTLWSLEGSPKIVNCSNYSERLLSEALRLGCFWMLKTMRQNNVILSELGRRGGLVSSTLDPVWPGHLLTSCSWARRCPCLGQELVSWWSNENSTYPLWYLRCGQL